MFWDNKFLCCMSVFLLELLTIPLTDGNSLIQCIKPVNLLLRFYREYFSYLYETD